MYNPSKYLIGGKGIQSQDMLKISENMLVYLHIQNIIFVNVFGKRRNYSFNIQNIRKIHLLGFPIKRLLEKSLEISRIFSIGPLFSKYD